MTLSIQINRSVQRSVEPDQTAPEKSTLFAILLASYGQTNHVQLFKF